MWARAEGESVLRGWACGRGKLCLHAARLRNGLLMCDVIIAGPHGCGFGWMAMTAGEHITIVPAASGNVRQDSHQQCSAQVWCEWLLRASKLAWHIAGHATHSSNARQPAPEAQLRNRCLDLSKQ